MSDRWAEVDLGAIRHNLRHVALLQRPGTDVIAVVKAGAYGHGAVPVAAAALRSGAWGLAVSTLGEARELLASVGEHDRVLALGGLVPAEAAEAAEVGCAVMCHRLDVARALDAAAVARDRVLPVHLKVDTGMGRLGCAPEEAVELAHYIAGAAGLRLAGTFTHFAASESDAAATEAQAQRFAAVLDQLGAAGLDPGLRHCSNSGGALLHPELGLDAVRVGIALYGYHPLAGGGGGLEPALALRALVTHVKTVPAGARVGYGGTWTAPRPARIATVAIGYADGVMRSRANAGQVLVRGQRAPLVGRVSMDAITLDVTAIEAVEVGDVATLVGRDGEESITADEVAEWSGTISYEVLTAIGPRVERRYSE